MATPLEQLIGHWSGTGVAKYPTFGHYDYTEDLVFKTRPGDERLLYEEQARKLKENNWVPSHWETGFLRLLEGSQVELVNVQITGRLEALRGELQLENGVLTISLRSILLLNDPRMIETTRIITVEGNHLRYLMDMATTATNQLMFHIEGNLTRT
ncbi:MAG TPA: FABP family protein [Phototrophicaceae bacterium]|nr:FABP family protein [Phototrophicaceae bacterium]